MGEGHKKAECEVFSKAKERKSLGKYADEIFEGRKANIADNYSNNHDTVRKHLDFNTTDNNNTIIENIDRANHDTCSRIENGNTFMITDTETVEQSNQDGPKEEARPKQLHDQGMLNLKSAEQAEFSGDPVNLVLGDSNVVRIHFKDPDVLNISQSGAAAAGIGSLLTKAK